MSTYKERDGEIMPAYTGVNAPIYRGVDHEPAHLMDETGPFVEQDPLFDLEPTAEPTSLRLIPGMSSLNVKLSSEQPAATLDSIEKTEPRFRLIDRELNDEWQEMQRRNRDAALDEIERRARLNAHRPSHKQQLQNARRTENENPSTSQIYYKD